MVTYKGKILEDSIVFNKLGEYYKMKLETLSCNRTLTVHIPGKRTGGEHKFILSLDEYNGIVISGCKEKIGSTDYDKVIAENVYLDVLNESEKISEKNQR